MILRHLPLALLILASSTALAAQTTVGPADIVPSGPSVSLKQLSIDLAGADDATRKDKMFAFKAATTSIKSCDDVDAAAGKVGAKVVSNTSVPIASMPQPLRDRVAKMALGTATPLFGDPKEGVVRSLVLCGRSDG